MSDSDNSDFSDSLNSLFDENDSESGPTIEYHDAPAATPSENESTSLSEGYNTYNEMNDNKPNEGMVIVQMDDGGPRMKRRKATEIVIPIDHVSSSEVLDNSQDDSDETTSSSNISSDTEENSSFHYDDRFLTEPAKTCKLNQSCTSSGSTTPSDEEPGCETSQSENRDSDFDENMDYPRSDDEEVCHDTSADDDVSETTPGSCISKTDCDSAGLSNASYLNICQKLKDGTAKFEEIADARDRLRRQIRTRPKTLLSNYIALRMYSSFSANYKMRNIGYVNLDSLPDRPNSANVGSVINKHASGVGDTAEIIQRNGTSLPADETPVENDSTSPVCSTRFDFTPAARSKIEGAVTACSEAANGAHSVESGRENPRAKQDSEVRPDNVSLKIPTVNLERRRHHQVLPPIPTGMNGVKLQTDVIDKPEVQTKSKPSSSLKSANRHMKSECHTRKQCLNAKPGIPHQLRSVACYQDGKVDVSITGDKRLIPESEPLNVNITFIHRPAVPQNKETNVTDVADDKTQVSKARPFPLPKKTISPALPWKGTQQHGGLPASYKRPLPALRNVPRTGNNKFGQLHNISTKAIDSRQICNIPSCKILPPLRNVQVKGKTCTSTAVKKSSEICRRKQSKKSTKKQSNLNWNIVNERAQWPPFNTHVNAEASERHQKIFADISV